jgi:hypothetical protein
MSWLRIGLFRASALTLLASAATALLASEASAITVNNYSFESPTLSGPGAYTIDTCPTSWNCSANGGQAFGGGIYVPTSTQFMSGSDGLTGGKIVPDGGQVAWTAGTTPQVLEQDVGTIAANTNYTLNVWAGARADETDAWSVGFQPTIELTANGVVVASLVTTDPGSGKWADFSLNWSAIAADVGETLGIVLVVPSRSPGDTETVQVAWDDVTLNAVLSAVPLPGALWLFGGGVSMIALAGRGRKRKEHAAGLAA